MLERWGLSWGGGGGGLVVGCAGAGWRAPVFDLATGGTDGWEVMQARAMVTHC